MRQDIVISDEEAARIADELFPKRTPAPRAVADEPNRILRCLYCSEPLVDHPLRRTACFPPEARISEGRLIRTTAERERL